MYSSILIFCNLDTLPALWKTGHGLEEYALSLLIIIPSCIWINLYVTGAAYVALAGWQEVSLVQLTLYCPPPPTPTKKFVLIALTESASAYVNKQPTPDATNETCTVTVPHHGTGCSGLLEFHTCSTGLIGMALPGFPGLLRQGIHCSQLTCSYIFETLHDECHKKHTWSNRTFILATFIKRQSILGNTVQA